MDTKQIRIFLALSLVLVTHGQAVIPLKTHLRVINGAAADINDTLTTIVNPKEWASNNNPQLNFVHVQINSGASVTHQEDVNLAEKSSLFIMQLFYFDNTTEIFKMNQQYVFKGDTEFEHVAGKRYITIGKTCNYTVVITVKD